MRSIGFAAVAGSALALVGFAGAANASATVDLIWAGSGTATTTNVAPSASITLQVILTAGPNGSQGAGVSVDYSSTLGKLTVLGYASTPGGALPLTLGTTSDTGSRIQNVNSGALPPYVGVGLSAGQSHQLGTITFQKSSMLTGTFEISPDGDGPTDGVLDLAGNDITPITAFNSALLLNRTVTATPTPGASPTPEPSTPTPTATPEPPTPTPTDGGSFPPTPTATSKPPTPTPTPSPTRTPEPTCASVWGVTEISTIGKGQSPSNNPKVSHTISGNIVDPGSLGETAHRIPVCPGTEVHVAVTDSTGMPANTAPGSLSCDPSGCWGVVNATEKYKSVSADGTDTDRMTFILAR